MNQTANSAVNIWKNILADPIRNRGMLADAEHSARENTEPTHVVFGTSGWRGEIGTDYTFRNVRIVTAAIIEMFRRGDSSVMEALGASSFGDIAERGVIVGHDNRFLGPDFAREVIGLLQDAGIRTLYAGEAPTPEFSAGVVMLNAACSINLTPSHNPANYAGFKFNPADGGPAGTEITTAIEEIANDMMRKGAAPPPVIPRSMESVDLTDLYIKFITERKTLDIARIRDFVRSGSCAVCIDNVHGSSRGRVERILGEVPNIHFLRTDDDYLFGGVAPEPSAKNMAGTEKVLAAAGSPFKLGVIMDPDGDRIRHTDGTVQIPMNHFGAMAFHFLHEYRKIDGVAVKSVATSNFVNAIAEKRGVRLHETKVGFKNFRPYLRENSKEPAVIAFEESDGISGYRHTLEKDAIFGLLVAIEMIAVTGKNLGDYLNDLSREYGAFFPDRSGIEVDRSLVGKPLLAKLAVLKQKYVPGTEVPIGNRIRTVRDMITLDGCKIVFDDGSWLLIRPSGTEPKVRFYIETRVKDDAPAMFRTAEEMTRSALG